MQAEPTDQRGGSLTNKYVKRKSADLIVPSVQMMLCGVELISSGSELHPLDLIPKNILIDSDQLEFRENYENSCRNRASNINNSIEDTRHTDIQAYSPTNHPKSFSHSEVGLESKSFAKSTVLSRKSSPRSYHSLGLCRLQIG